MKLYANFSLANVAPPVRRIAVFFCGEGRRPFWRREEAFFEKLNCQGVTGLGGNELCTAATASTLHRQLLLVKESLLSAVAQRVLADSGSETFLLPVRRYMYP